MSYVNKNEIIFMGYRKKNEIMINRINKNIKKLKKISSSFKIYLI